MSVVEELHLIQVGLRVVPSDADMAPRFCLGQAPNIHYPFMWRRWLCANICTCRIKQWRYLLLSSLA